MNKTGVGFPELGDYMGKIHCTKSRILLQHLVLRIHVFGGFRFAV